MYLGFVIGSVVASVQAEGLAGHKLLLVQPVDEQGKPAGAKQVAVDTVRAGPGDHVFLVGSREAALAVENTFVPIDAAIVGIIDDLWVDGAPAAPPQAAALPAKPPPQAQGPEVPMRIARVLGSLVATAQHPTYGGRKIMVVQEEHPGGQRPLPAFVAVDLVQAGPGDRVLVLTEGNGVRQLLGKDSGPIRSVIVGVVDAVEPSDSLPRGGAAAPAAEG